MCEKKDHVPHVPNKFLGLGHSNYEPQAGTHTISIQNAKTLIHEQKYRFQSGAKNCNFSSNCSNSIYLASKSDVRGPESPSVKGKYKKKKNTIQS